MYETGVLECQGCGKAIRVLTKYKEQQVSDKPYNFVGYCELCWKIYNMGTWKLENDPSIL